MINIVNETELDIDEKLIKKCARETLKTKKLHGNLTIILVGEEKIREYNKGKATDVLSFESVESAASQSEQMGLLQFKDSGRGDYLGEIIICPKYIKENVQNFEWELCHAVVHGTLHLLGIHHDSEKTRQKLHELEKNIIKKTYGKG
jgi:rRNA maturation RNase YbeY